VNDAVDKVILERQALDRGFPGSVLVSIAAHSFLAGGILIASLLAPKEPLLRVMDGFAAEIPRGGGGGPQAPAPAEVPPPVHAPPATEAPAPETKEAAPSFIRPPKELPPARALPDLEKKHHTKPTPPPPNPGGHGKPGTHAQTRSGMPGGTGTSSQPLGIELGPQGFGNPNGTETGGDWYIASVQQKIWMIWTQQIKENFNQPIGVTFTIDASGNVDMENVRLTQPSGSTLLDLAAKRAVMTAGPFGPLPKDYGTNRITIEATFKPTS
jgi:TonB family protein